MPRCRPRPLWVEAFACNSRRGARDVDAGSSCCELSYEAEEEQVETERERERQRFSGHV